MQYVSTMALMLATLLVVVAMSACGAAPDDTSTVMASGRPVGELRGTELINKMIKVRMLDAAAPGTETFQIEKLAGNDIYGMRTLLGQYADGGSAEFRGGEPNPFGLLMWHQVIVRFAQGIAQGCDANVTTVGFFDGSQAKLADAFGDKLDAVCAWPAASTDRAAVTGKLWRGLAGFGAPIEETAFTAFFAGDTSPFAASTPKERVEAMVTAALLNPHVLLEK